MDPMQCHTVMLPMGDGTEEDCKGVAKYIFEKNEHEYAVCQAHGDFLEKQYGMILRLIPYDCEHQWTDWYRISNKAEGKMRFCEKCYADEYTIKTA